VEKLNERMAKMKAGKHKTALKKVRDSANAALGSIGSSLTDVQGNVIGVDPYATVTNIASVPKGAFGGKIGDVISALSQAGGSASATDSDALDLQTTLNQQLATALAVSQAQYPIAQKIPQLLGYPYAGAFASGGLVRALVGEQGPELATFPVGTRISPAGSSASQGDTATAPNVEVVVNGHILPYEDTMRDLVEVYVDGMLVKAKSRQDRRL
jgi:hypothetical protein